jgi:hypothetical protein
MAEFSRPLSTGALRGGGRSEVLEASAPERAALAQRFGIPAVGRLRAELLLTPEQDGAVLVTGRMEASVTQECVLTLDPVEQRIEERVALRLLPAGREPADGPDDDADDIATAADGVADLGEALAQQLALALDPYPRAEGAALPATAADSPANSFGVLAALGRRH